MTIDLDDLLSEKLDVNRISTMLTTLSADTTSKEELERVRREQAIAKTSLYRPSVTAQLPSLFTLQNSPQQSRLVDKISRIGSTEDGARITQAASSAFPAATTATSIYDIASTEPTDRPKEHFAKSKEIEIEETPFPNLVLEIVTADLKMEGFQTDKLAGHKREGDALKEKMNDLVKLSSHLPKLNSEDTSYELKEETNQEILKIHQKLVSQGIDLFPGMPLTENKLSKEHLAATNSLINHHIEASKTSLQELFTTKLSISTQFLSMINEVTKKIIEKDDHLKRKTMQNN
jgi:hypothetical protein